MAVNFLTFFIGICAFPEILGSPPITQKLRSFELCNADLEKKFLVDTLKCPYSGLFPVKGSCTAYIPCISFGENLMRPLKQTECASGLSFDVFYSRCRALPPSQFCLQRLCYPPQSSSEDVSQSTQPSLEERSSTVHPPPQEDFDEISVDLITPPGCIENPRKPEDNEDRLTSSSAPPYHDHYKSVWPVLSRLLSVWLILKG